MCLYAKKNAIAFTMGVFSLTWSKTKQYSTEQSWDIHWALKRAEKILIWNDLIDLYIQGFHWVFTQLITKTISCPFLEYLKQLKLYIWSMEYNVTRQHKCKHAHTRARTHTQTDSRIHLLACNFSSTVQNTPIPWQHCCHSYPLSDLITPTAALPWYQAYCPGC